MSKTQKIFSIITWIFGVISLVWIFYDMYQIKTNLSFVIQFDKVGIIMGVGYLFIIFFHILSFIFIAIHFRFKKQFDPLRNSILILGIISFLAFGIEKVMVDEVGREYFLEWPAAPGEVMFLYLCLGIHALFVVMVLFFISKFLMISKKQIDGVPN